MGGRERQGGSSWCGQVHQGHSGHAKLSLFSDQAPLNTCTVVHLHMHAQVKRMALLFLLVGNWAVTSSRRTWSNSKAPYSLLHSNCSHTGVTLDPGNNTYCTTKLHKVSNCSHTGVTLDPGNNTYCTTKLHKVKDGVPEATRLIPLSK